MKNSIIATSLLLLLVIALGSCKKAITVCSTCTRVATIGSCAACTLATQPNYNFCDTSNLAGKTFDDHLATVKAAGYLCSTSYYNKMTAASQDVCYTDDASKNTAITAKATLEAQGYTCVDKK